MENGEIEKINRIFYWWVRYEGTHCPEGKTFSKGDISELISRLERYKEHPEKFDWDKGGVPEQGEE